MRRNYIPTGNEFISLPCICEENGSILDFTFLHMGFKGLIDVRGNEEHPILTPKLIVNRQEKKFHSLSWDRINDWIPCFHGELDGIKLSGIILTPIHERGFIYQIQVTNTSKEKMDISLGFTGTWLETYHSINEDKKIEAPRYVYSSGWNDSLVFDLRVGVSVFAFAPIFDQKLESSYEQKNNGAITYRFLKDQSLDVNENVTITSYWGLGFEEVAATTSAKELLRQGFDYEFNNTSKWLSKRQKSVGDEQLNHIMNKNLFFNFFYASGLTLDTEEMVLVTSRSPRYYVSAAYWDRDSLLWSFPAVLLVDTEYARKMLLYVFGRQIKNIGIHSRYIDGTVLEPGFELDELCAPIIALYNYICKTGDRDFLSKDCISEGVNHILNILEQKRHPSVALYETFLQPTDDMRLYPYITYDNVLVWRLYKNLIELYQGRWNKEKLESLEKEAQSVLEAIITHCVKEYEGKNIYAWSVDLEGNWNVYDEPPGSIQLFPHYGFCEANQETYLNTVAVIRRPEYPYSFRDCNIAEIGCPHAPHPWVLSVANGLLCGRTAKGKEMLLKMSMDNGIACESVDEITGKSTTGDAFATCAGFLSYAIYEAYKLVH